MINWYLKFLLIYSLILLLNPINAEILNNKVPTPKKVPVTFEAHGVKRVDNYYWMRDDTRKDTEVISHLESENKYLEGWFDSGEDLRDKLFEEITDRIPKKEDSVPVRLKSYEYFRRYEPGNEHGIYIRRKNKNAKEFVLIDVNELADGSEFYQLANWSISPNEDLMAYAEDTTGRREYNIKFKNLNTGQTYENRLSNSSGDMAWSSDGRYLFYVLRDPETLLPFKLYRHEIGSSQSLDVLVYEEKDPTFYLSVGNSRSMQFIEVNISSTTSSEVRLIDSESPEESPYIFLKRESDHLYSIEHDPENNRFLIETNWLAKNFRLMAVDLKKSSYKDEWNELIPHREDILLQSALAFPDHLVIMERKNGLRKLKIITKKDNAEKNINFNDPAYSAYLAANPEYYSDKFYFGYSSLRTPDSLFSS
ncbi:MAG: S9 family peptidase, partial [Gammaproteobacteria bacterium]